ncbi:MAG TPA: hypothetical protein VFW19_11640 [Allosphingosinicella sp.]|nr:hypothetical protein [Allosphingosinicella sp.]
MAVAAALLAGACTREDPMAGQIACQQRMVNIPSAKDAAPQARWGKGLADAFETMSRRYAAMDMHGCADDQHSRARIMAQVTHRIATLAVRLPKDAPGRATDLADRTTFMEFADEMEGFENRRVAMQQELDRMRAVRLR